MGFIHRKSSLRRLRLEKRKKVSTELKNDNSLLIILANNQRGKDKYILSSVVHDIANVKRLFLSDRLEFKEENTIVLFNKPKSEVYSKLNEVVNSQKWDKIVFYYSGYSLNDDDFAVLCHDNSDLLTATEIRTIFNKVTSDIILFFDCSYAQRIFEFFYDKDVFLLGAAGKNEVAYDVKGGGAFTKAIVDIFDEGIDSNKNVLNLNEIYLELHKKFLKMKFTIPKMLTTNIVQYQPFMENNAVIIKNNENKELIQKSKQEIIELIQENELLDAFEQLTALIISEELKNKFILFQNRFIDLEDNKMLGLIDKDDADTEKNKIVYGLLKLIEQLS